MQRTGGTILAKEGAVKLELLQLGQVNIANPCTGVQLRNYYLARQLAEVMNVTHLGFRHQGDLGAMAGCDNGIRMTLVPKEPAYTVSGLVRGALGRIPVTLLNFQS